MDKKIRKAISVEDEARDKKIRKAIFVAFCFILLFVFVKIFLFGPGEYYAGNENDARIRADLKTYVQRLNDPSLGNAAYTLENDYWIVRLNEYGAVWQLEVDDTDPRICNIIGLVPGRFWDEMWIDKKENLLKGIVVCVYDITKDKNNFKVTIKDRNSGKVLAKRDYWGFKVYE